MAERFEPNIDAFWNSLNGFDGSGPVLDAELAATINHMHTLYAVTPPSSTRERARQRVLDPTIQPLEDARTMDALVLPGPIPARPNPAQTATGSRGGTWKPNLWMAVAAVLIVLLASLGSWFAYEQFGSDSNAPAVIPATQATPGNDWPMYRGDNGRTSASSSFGPKELPVEYWRFDLGASADASPVVVANVVYAGDGNGILHAVDALTGKERWQFTGDASLETTPAVFDGVVFVPSANGTLYAITAETGEELWQFDKPVTDFALPVALDGVVYVGSPDGNLYAIDAANGQERWHFTTGGPIPFAQALVGDQVFTGSNDGFLYAIDASDGSKRWAFDTGQDTVGSPAVADGTVFVRRAAGGMFAIDAATGEQRFLIDGPNDGNFTQASVAGGTVYLGGSGGNLYAYSAADGSSRWTATIDEGFTASPAIADGIVYAAGDDGTLYALEAGAGNQLWQVEIGGSVAIGPSVSDGVIYLSSTDGNVVVLGEAGHRPIIGTVAAASPVANPASSGFDQSSVQVAWQTVPDAVMGLGPLAVAPDGTIYAVDFPTDTVHIFDPDGKHTGSFGETGSGPGQFKFHEGTQNELANIDTDADGNIYVFDTFNSRVQKFAPDGTFLLQWGSNGTANGQFQETAGGVDPVGKRVYVTDLTGRVQVFDLEGNFLDKWGTSGTGPGKFLNPLDVVADSKGNAFVSQEENGPIQLFDPYGQYIASITPPDGHFSLVLSMALDANGNLFVANYNANAIQIFAPDGAMIGEITAYPDGTTVDGPVGVAFDSDGFLYISEEGSGRISKLQIPPLS